MTSQTAKPRKNRAPHNLAMGVVGLVAVVILISQHAVTLPGWLRMLSAFALIYAIPAMFFTRKSDEYTQELWSSGATAAFAVSVFFFLALSVGQGIANSFLGENDMFRSKMEYAFDVTLLAFFLTFNIKRVTGAM